MKLLKVLSLLVMSVAGISISQAETTFVRDDSLAVSGFDFADENKLRTKDIYGSCYRLEEPIFVDLKAEGNWVSGNQGWLSKVRYTLAESKIIDPTRLKAKNRDGSEGITWLDDGTFFDWSIGIGILKSNLYQYGERKKYNTYLGSAGKVVSLYGWEIETARVADNITDKRINIPTRNLKTLEFVFTSDANNSDVYLMFEREPGTNYMKNTSIYYPEKNRNDPPWVQSMFGLEPIAGNKLTLGDQVNNAYSGFNLVRTELISFRARQYWRGAPDVKMGVYEPKFSVEGELSKYGLTAAEFDAACK